MILGGIILVIVFLCCFYSDFSSNRQVANAPQKGFRAFVQFFTFEFDLFRVSLFFQQNLRCLLTNNPGRHDIKPNDIRHIDTQHIYKKASVTEHTRHSM